MNFVRIMLRSLCKGLCGKFANTWISPKLLQADGHNPRGNAICERVNQTLGAMIRKLSDLDYKDLRNFLPSFEFMINTTLSSATKCTPFEIAHGLPARTIAQARIEAQRVGRGAADPEILEDVSPVFD